MRIEESESNGEWDWPLAVNTRTAPMGLFSDRRWGSTPQVHGHWLIGRLSSATLHACGAKWDPAANSSVTAAAWDAVVQMDGRGGATPGSGGVAAYIPSLRLSRRSPHLWFDVFADTKWVRETLPWWKIVARKRPAAKLESESWHGKFLHWTSMGRLRWNLHRRGIDFSWRI